MPTPVACEPNISGAITAVTATTASMTRPITRPGFQAKRRGRSAGASAMRARAAGLDSVTLFSESSGVDETEDDVDDQGHDQRDQADHEHRGFRPRAWSRLRPAELGDAFDNTGHIPLGRVGEHQELSNLAAFLLSDFAGFITGTCVTIDGGAWLRGAGQFNHLEQVSGPQWDELQAAVKSRREK